jgi:Ala-tRNA(Pro) deacylase
MLATRLIKLLHDKHVKYSTISHQRTLTAQETAESAHVPGINFAKTVIVLIDGKYAMAVLPAQYKIHLGLLKQQTKANQVSLATEEDFKDLFPECTTGAMPPFGNLYGMEVYVDDCLLEDEEIVFNAGSHTELIKLSYDDFMRLAQPKVSRFAALH